MNIFCQLRLRDLQSCHFSEISFRKPDVLSSILDRLLYIGIEHRPGFQYSISLLFLVSDSSLGEFQDIQDGDSVGQYLISIENSQFEVGPHVLLGVHPQVDFGSDGIFARLDRICCTKFWH